MSKKKTSRSFLIATLVTIGGVLMGISGLFSPSPAYAAAPTFTAARTALNTIVLTFSEAVDADAADETTAWTVAGATVTAVTDPGNTDTLTITTTGLTSTSSTPTVTYVAANGTVVNAGLEEITDGTNANAADQVPPTFTAARTALNTIVLTFSETVDAADTATAAWTVAGATVSAVTDPNSSTTLTITTTGLTSTSSTPAVNYVAASGTVKDVSAATNEVANGGAVSAADQVPPTFTAARTALNTIVLTFSENVTSGGVDTDSFTVEGASTVSAGAVVGNTSITLTTTGLTSTSSTPAVNYVAASGDVLDASAATNELANGGAVSAADQVIPVFVSATVNGAELVMTYGESLNSSSTPATSSFVVSVGGVARTPKSVSVSGTSVRLSLAADILGGQTVTVAYTVPGGDKIEDASAATNDAASLSATSVTNNTETGQGGTGGSSNTNETSVVPSIPVDGTTTPATTSTEEAIVSEEAPATTSTEEAIVSAPQEEQAETSATVDINAETKALIAEFESLGIIIPSWLKISVGDYSGLFARSLKIGSRGEDVRALQEFLNAQGFILAEEGPGSPENETTLFGKLTRRALAQFQAANGLNPSGVLDAETRDFIDSLSAE